jgi:hypothetical protein
LETNENPDIRKQVKIIEADQLYQIRDENGQLIDYDKADGRELFNHYRHSMTNYDQVLDDTRDQQGYVTGWQAKKASVGAAEQVLEKYRDEHVKVILDSQKKGQFLKNLMTKAGVGTASALSTFLDSCSDKIKDIAKLENSQRALQTWNDTYRVQRELVRKILADEKVSKEAIAKVNAVYGTRSVNKAVELGSELFKLEKSEILKLVKTAIRYTNL